MDSNGYGRIPPDDVTAVLAAVKAVSNVMHQLPALVPADWDNAAMELLLSAILDDWVRNGTNELEADVEHDLVNFVTLAIDAAQAEAEPYRSIVFRVALSRILNDWVLNWNSDV